MSEAGFGRRTIGEGKVDAAPRPPPKCGFFASTSSSGTLNAAAGARHARATRSSSSASPIKGFAERAAMTTGAALRDASNAGARVSKAFFRPGATCAYGPQESSARLQSVMCITCPLLPCRGLLCLFLFGLWALMSFCFAACDTLVCVRFCISR